MADRMFHFAAGMLLGMAIGLPAVALAWRRGRDLAMPMARLLLLTGGVGLFAVIPGILRCAGMPEAICRGWWMNVFVFHPLLDSVASGGMLSGSLAVCAMAAAEYVLLLAALVRARRA